MDNQESELIEKVRQQFDQAPYPKTPLEKSPNDDLDYLFIHSLITPYYLRNQKIIETKEKLILEAGCGSGYNSLALAAANPGAKIVGIDISEESVKLARQRLQYHGFENTEFYVLAIEDLPSLDLEFDYINNDELLYLFPNPATALKSMKSVLKPDGIIRSNLHSSLQRFFWYRAQEVFKMMGLLDENPRELEIEIVRETMKALKDGVDLKIRTWRTDREDNEEYFLMNYLFQGDKGYTIPEMFAALRTADLEFVSMVNWRHWELIDLFKEPDNLPAFLAMSLPQIYVEDRLHLFELLNPCHRLLDFWCAHPKPDQPFVAVAEWTQSEWQSALVYLHPQLKIERVREDLLQCITKRSLFEISKYITLPTLTPMLLESSVAACLLPLWEGAQTFSFLVERWVQIRPLHPATLEPVSEQTAFEEVKELLSSLETFLYVLLERSV